MTPTFFHCFLILISRSLSYLFSAQPVFEKCEHVTSLKNMLDFEFTICLRWQAFSEVLVTLTLNVDGQRRYTTLWRAGTTVKVTLISLKTILKLFPVLSRVWNKGIITMVLKKSNIAVTVSPKKIYGDSLKLILVYRRWWLSVILHRGYDKDMRY